jgi:predicted nuclease of predicted toxin-antitoxin system
VKVLFDHNVPHRLRHSLPAHEVSSADEMGWSELENGELMRAAELSGFVVMVTADQNISAQQNLRGMKLALVVLRTNNWNVLKDNPGPVAEAVDAAKPGTFQVVNFGPRPRPEHR